MINPVQDHPAPAKPSSHFEMPEMTTDGNGHAIIARAKESFSNLTLEGSELTAQEPIFGHRTEYPTFIRELWQFRWRPNDPIDVYIILPRNVTKPPVSLYLYGYPNDTDTFKNDGFCERATRNGVAVIGFVSALTGQRYTNRPYKEWFISELPESLASTVHDVQMILNMIQQRKDLDVDMTRVGIFGQGSGGAIAILAASVDKRIQAVDLLDPWGDWPDWFPKAYEVPEKERASYLTDEFQKKLEALEPVKALPALKDRKVRINFAGPAREAAEAVKKLESAAPSKAEIHHLATSEDERNAFAAGRLFDWMAEQLHAARPQPVKAETTATTGAAASPPLKDTSAAPNSK
jgi:hypothetical protein